MAILSAPLPPVPAGPVAGHVTGAVVNQDPEAAPVAGDFPQLLAIGLADMAGGTGTPVLHSGKQTLHQDDLRARASDLQDGVQQIGQPPVLAFVLASLGHSAAAPMQAAAKPATAALQTGAERISAPDPKVWPAIDALRNARDEPVAPTQVSVAHEIAAADSNGARTAEASIADALAPPVLSGQAQAGLVAHAPASGETVAVSEISTPVGAPGWGDEVGQKLVWMAGNGHQVAELTLNPPHLGPVHIIVSLSGDQGNQATVQFASAHASVREAIQSAIPHLHAMLADSGIRLDQSSVSAESFRDSGASRDRGGSGSGLPGGPESAAGDQAHVRMRAGNSLIDTFA